MFSRRSCCRFGQQCAACKARLSFHAKGLSFEAAKRQAPESAAAGGGAAGAEDEELTVPRAAMNKMIKELLPNVRIANEARELILACCTEFIHHLSTEANDICNRQQKKTISADHVLGALDSLGFGAYRQDAEAVLKDCKAVAAKRRRQSTRLENLGIPEEELLRQQQELFAQVL
ncbi:hypothetical protein HPB48_000718 [Haemaphysalis longicornis]|uniref:Protein Dr1 n=1 Tax=Haemaphysalis longicornis TaxID=44386 RepID=A0A9J6FCM3_HAELO|nr:hypothetical protein HPB48_000718 [Haemaphysalis longicornis]